jgi:UDP-glucose 4-epimerase
VSRVVVTGGAGFIGANLCRHLADAGYDVVALDDLSTGCADNLAGTGVPLVTGSVLDAGLLADVLEGAASVVHLAALPSVPRSVDNPMASHEANATGTVRVLDAARLRGTHVVVASSSSVYGRNPTLPKSEDLTPMPMSPYAVSKLAAEQYALAYAVCYGLAVLPFRLFNVFGPLQRPDHAYAAAVPVFLSRAMRGEPLPVQGDGSQTRDFTFVGTVTAVLERAVERRLTSPDPVNLAFGTRTTLTDLIERIRAVVGRDVTIERGPARVGDVLHTQADSGRLRALVPDVEAVPLDVGLARTAEWMRGQLA